MKIHNLLMLASASILLLLVAGCSGNSSDPAVIDEEPQGIAMVLDQEYAVGAGDMLVPEDEETRIVVRHVYADDKKYVTLLAGSATLVVGAADLQR
ncbi:MAG: hypothetical protein IH614_10320 [Desulfuromonadales bacterium]|nr:hypothetical protein [Desulfuromonadales bacterium]